jgi:hypothetical protein
VIKVKKGMVEGSVIPLRKSSRNPVNPGGTKRASTKPKTNSAASTLAKLRKTKKS